MLKGSKSRPLELSLVIIRCWKIRLIAKKMMTNKQMNDYGHILATFNPWSKFILKSYIRSFE